MSFRCCVHMIYLSVVSEADYLRTHERHASLWKERFLVYGKTYCHMPEGHLEYRYNSERANLMTSVVGRSN